PGPLAGPPPGRRAKTSGGVRSSFPSRKGSVSGSTGGGGSTCQPPPGRRERSAATIVRRPESGSMRSSGNRLLHRHVVDALLDERLAALRVAVLDVESASRELRVEGDPAGAVLGRAPRRLAKQGAGDSAPPQLAGHHQAPEEGKIAVEHEAAGADHRAVLDRHEVQRLAVTAVALGGQIDALLPTEHLLAELERLLDLVRVDHGPHVHAGGCRLHPGHLYPGVPVDVL